MFSFDAVILCYFANTKVCTHCFPYFLSWLLSALG